MMIQGSLPGMGQRAPLNPQDRAKREEKQQTRYENILRSRGVVTPDMAKKDAEERKKAFEKATAEYEAEKRALNRLIC